MRRDIQDYVTVVTPLLEVEIIPVCSDSAVR